MLEVGLLPLVMPLDLEYLGDDFLDGAVQLLALLDLAVDLILPLLVLLVGFSLLLW